MSASCPARPDDMLKAGALITHTEASVSLENLIGQFMYSSGGSTSTTRACRRQQRRPLERCRPAPAPGQPAASLISIRLFGGRADGIRHRVVTASAQDELPKDAPPPPKAAAPAAPPPEELRRALPPGTMIDQPVAMLQALDKITARVKRLPIKVGQTALIRNLVDRG